MPDASQPDPAARRSHALPLPAAETHYLRAIVDVLRHQLNDQLLAVYLLGSAATDAYEPGISDLDVQAVVREALDTPGKQRLAGQLAHGRLPCPARRLEFVLYTRDAIDPAQRRPHFELNYNTGSDVADHLTLDPADEAGHWFLLDLALGRELGRPLLGPEPAVLVAPIPRRWQLDAIDESLRWHAAHEAASANSVLNACRGWRYAETGRHGSKHAGAHWAMTQPDCPPVVAQAEQRRHGGPPLDPVDVAELMAIVGAAVARALQREPEGTVERTAPPSE